MLLQIIKTKGGTNSLLKCDKCGKEFIRNTSLTRGEKHYCCRKCAKYAHNRTGFKFNALYETSSDKCCVVCNKAYSNDFYDKGDMGRASNGGVRYLCSKECRDILYEKLFRDEIEFYKRLYSYELKRKSVLLSVEI